MARERLRPRRPKELTPLALSELSDEGLLRMARTAVIDRMDVRIGDFVLPSGSADRTPPEALDALCGEVVRRDLSPRLGALVAAEAMATRPVADLLNPVDWRRYELHAARALVLLLKDLGVTIDKEEFDAKVFVAGRKHSLQVDLLLTQLKPLHVISVEIKHYTHTVPVGDLEQFATRVKKLGVDQGAFMTVYGYQQGAKEVADEAGIELYTFREISAEEAARHGAPAAPLSGTSTHWLLQDLRCNSRVLAGELTMPRGLKRGAASLR